MGIDTIQAANVNSLVKGIDIADRNSFIGFDLGTIQLDANNNENVANLLDLYFDLNPIDQGSFTSPNATIFDFGSI